MPTTEAYPCWGWSISAFFYRTMPEIFHRTSSCAPPALGNLLPLSHFWYRARCWTWPTNMTQVWENDGREAPTLTAGTRFLCLKELLNKTGLKEEKEGKENRLCEMYKPWAKISTIARGNLKSKTADGQFRNTSWALEMLFHSLVGI